MPPARLSIMKYPPRGVTVSEVVLLDPVVPAKLDSTLDEEYVPLPPTNQYPLSICADETSQVQTNKQVSKVLFIILHFVLGKQSKLSLTYLRHVRFESYFGGFYGSIVCMRSSIPIRWILD